LTMAAAAAFVLHKIVAIVHIVLFILLIVAVILTWEPISLITVAAYGAIVVAGVGLWVASSPSRNVTRRAVCVWYIIYASVGSLLAAIIFAAVIMLWFLSGDLDSLDTDEASSDVFLALRIVLTIILSGVAVVTAVDVVTARQLVPTAAAAAAETGCPAEFSDVEAGSTADPAAAGPVA